MSPKHLKRSTSFRLSDASLNRLNEVSEFAGLTKTDALEAAIELYDIAARTAHDTAEVFIGEIRDLTATDTDREYRPLILNLREGWVSVAGGDRAPELGVHTWNATDALVAIALSTSDPLPRGVPDPTGTDRPILVIATLDRASFAASSLVHVDPASLRPDAQYLGGRYRTVQEHVLDAIRTAIRQKGGNVSTKEVGAGEPPRFV